MHLRDHVRSDLFQQIDQLLDPCDWDDECALIRVESFETFLRFLTLFRDVKRPALSVSMAGNLMASWISPPFRMTIEFLVSDQMRLVAHKEPVGSAKESIAFEGHISRLDHVLAPLNAIGLYREAT